MTIAEPTLDELVDAEAVFDEILKELLGEQKSRVRADVATHTETMWGTHKDLEAARKRLVLEAAKLVAAGLRPSTRSSHRSGCRTYEHFCDVFRFRAYGLSDEQLTMFTAFSLKRVWVASVEQYLKAIRSACVDMGIKAPTLSSMPRLQRALQGAEKAGKPDGSFRLPITLQMLRDMVTVVIDGAKRAEAGGEVVPVGSGLGDPLQRVAMYLVVLFDQARSRCANLLMMRTRQSCACATFIGRRSRTLTLERPWRCGRCFLNPPRLIRWAPAATL